MTIPRHCSWRHRVDRHRFVQGFERLRVSGDQAQRVGGDVVLDAGMQVTPDPELPVTTGRLEQAPLSHVTRRGPPGLPLLVPLGGKCGLNVGNRLCPTPSE